MRVEKVRKSVGIPSILRNLCWKCKKYELKSGKSVLKMWEIRIENVGNLSWKWEKSELKMWEISVENVWNPSTCEKIWEIREEQVWVSSGTIWLSFIRLHWVKQLGHWVLDNPSKIYKSKQIYYKFQPHKLYMILTLYTKHTYQSCRTFWTPVHINLIFAIWTFYENL